MLEPSSSEEDDYEDQIDSVPIHSKPIPAPRQLNNGGHVHKETRNSNHYNSTRSNHSGSSGSPVSQGRTVGFDNNKQGGSIDTVSICSGLSVPQSSADNRSYDGIPNSRYYSSSSRSNSLRGCDRSPQPPRRAGSPSASITSDIDKERDDLEQLSQEQAERRKRLQIYVFVMRCISFPFNAKHPHDMQRRHAKVTKKDLAKIKERFDNFLNGKTNIIADEALINAVRSYYEVFLMSDNVSEAVRKGAYSAHDFREVFCKNIEKRVKLLPVMPGLSKETVLTSWKAKFDALYNEPGCENSTSAPQEIVLSKDQLYEMFQKILNVDKIDHLNLYNALQVSLSLVNQFPKPDIFNL